MYLAALDVVARGGGNGPRFIFPLLLILFLLLGAKLIRRRRGKHFVGHGTPMRTLQERFANGEIDRAEFEHRKAVLLGEEIVPAAPTRPVAPSPQDDAPEPPAPAEEE